MSFQVLNEADFTSVSDGYHLIRPYGNQTLYIGGGLTVGRLMDPGEFDEALDTLSVTLSDVYETVLDVDAYRQETSTPHINAASIHGRSGGKLMLSVFLFDLAQEVMRKRRGKLLDYTKFASYFPAEDLKKQTVEALPMIWPLIEGIRFKEPISELGASSGEGDIILREPFEERAPAKTEPAIIATGRPALDSLGIDVPVKNLFKVAETG
jgi:hypothetical protein